MGNLGWHSSRDMDIGLYHRRSHPFLRGSVGVDELSFRLILWLDLLGYCIHPNETRRPGAGFLCKERDSWLGRIRGQRVHHLRWAVLCERWYLRK